MNITRNCPCIFLPEEKAGKRANNIGTAALIKKGG